MSFKQEFDYGKLFYYILLVMAIAALLWFNFKYLNNHVSSNSVFINDFVKPVVDNSKNRPPAVAGIFYQADAHSLDKDLDSFLSSARIREKKRPEVLIVPHAGYVYSASTAAAAYVQLKPFASEIKNIIIVGPSHYVAVEGASVSGADSFTTPLGKILVNRKMAQEIAASPGFLSDNAAHVKEHSIEVQLPFLQKVLKNFQIVPVAYGNISPEALAQGLKPYVGRPDTVIVFSADLSHYYTYGQAKTIDEKTAQMIEGLEPEIKEHMSCGAAGVNAALILASETNLYPKLLDMKNSGDILGDKNSVVGYASWMFEKKPQEQKASLSKMEQEFSSLQDFASVYKQDLLKIAKDSITEAVLHDEKYSPSRHDYANALFDKGASFVTLEESGELKGCIGTVVPHQGVAVDVAQNAALAATRDSRFSPLTAKDLPKISVSISLLTDFVEISYDSEADLLNKITPGADGIILKDGNRQALYLPSVWKDLPDKKEFIKNLKLKAGMSPNYWSNAIKVYQFRTVEIKENEN